MTRIELGTLLFAALGLTGCLSTNGGGGGDGDIDADVDADADGDTDADADTDTDTDTDSDGDPEAELLADIAGEWHGSIGEGYRNGCLCLTLDEAGDVIEPSGITLGFDVTGGSTTIVDVATREIDIMTFVEGGEFHIREATVDEGGTFIDGLWEGNPPSAFDDTIQLDREPATCRERTGLDGAPC